MDQLRKIADHDGDLRRKGEGARPAAEAESVGVRIGVVLPQFDVDYAEWRAAAVAAEELGVDVITAVDHFFSMRGDGGCLEAMTLMAAAAEATSRAELGHTVLANSYRNPHLLANMARTIDRISSGRFILGLGAGGTLERDYEEYGYELGTTASRLRHLSRDLPTIRQRLRTLVPAPFRSVPIMVGGAGEKVTLRIVAEHADIWHSFSSPQALEHKREVLGGYCMTLGRDVNEIEVSSNVVGPSGEYDPDRLYQAGARLLFVAAAPSAGGYDLGRVREVLAWRRAADLRAPA